MQSQGQWKLLDLQLEGLPTLLIRSFFTKSAFQVHLSDLSRVWSQSYSTRDIKKHALNIDCPIDPTEDASQMTMLLAKLESALQQEVDTAVTLASKADSGNDLTMSLSVPLPSPLPALAWTLDLQQLPSEQVAAELVNPLLLEADLLRRQMQQLIDEIRDKDRVISRMSDRLEASGNDLTNVFPGVSNIKLNRKKPQREQLARHVKGLVDFDEADWRARKAEHVAEGPLAFQTLESVLADLKVPNGPFELYDAKMAWWERLQGSGSTSRKPERSSVGGQRRRGGSVDDSPPEAKESVEDRDFQRQQAPPGHRQGSSGTVNAPSAPANIVMDGSESTEDKDDLDAPLTGSQSSSQTCQNQSQPFARPASSSPSPALNTRASEVVPSASPAPKPRKFGTLGGPSATPKSPAKRDETPQSADVVSLPKKVAAKGRFGTIGGKAKPAPAALASPEPAVSEPATPSKGKRLGTIGGKKDGTTKSPSNTHPVAPEKVDDPVREGRAGQARSRKQSTPPAQRETSQERADKKRAQLKRELEEKAKAPVKKKRKF